MTAHRVITTRSQIRSVAERWHRQYPDGGRPDQMRVGRELDRLDVEKATAEEVREIIGNDSWTRLSCSQCDEVVDAVVMVGEEMDYESSTAFLCLSCVTAAADELRKAVTL